MTVSSATTTISRMSLSPHRQIGPGSFEAGHNSACVILNGAVARVADSVPEQLNRGQVYSPQRGPHDSVEVVTPTELIMVNPRRFTPKQPSPLAGGNAFDSWRMPEHSLSLFESLCDWLYTTSTDVPTASIEAAETALLTLLDQPLQDYTRHGLRDSVHAVVFEEAMRIVDTEFRDSDLNAPSLAKRLQVSLRTLHRAFESRAISISKEIRRRRIEYAEALLLNPRYSHVPVSEIAKICGAPSIGYLRTGIKEKHDLSPSQLREMCRVGVPSA
ncbi:helix-turn-helix domain-containing protein [Rhodococcus sp. BE178]|uniref:helix-turn-helix domain-containing protein n=1 Tax=Rhodococcus sp. BE178 TaxID=2817737 RepID=UPI003D1F442D